MITYFDTSSLLKVVIDEMGSEQAGVIWDTADVLASVSLVTVEARAALAAAVRNRRLTNKQLQRAKTVLAALVDEMNLVEVTEELVGAAAELAEDEALRGYDAVHLAAALFIEARILTSADTDMCAAANRRGLHVANPLAH